MRGVTIGLGGVLKDLHISTHTPHARRDHGDTLYIHNSRLFQLTRLMRGVTCHPNSAIAPKQAFQLTRLMRGVTLPSESLPTVVITISTHTPHARRDMRNCDGSHLSDISTHTPHARRDLSIK